MRIIRISKYQNLLASMDKFCNYHLAVEQDRNYYLFYVQNGLVKRRRNKDDAYKGVIAVVVIPTKIVDDSMEFAEVKRWLLKIGIKEENFDKFIDNGEWYKNFINHNNSEYKKYHFKFRYSKNEFEEFERIHIPSPFITRVPAWAMPDSLFYNWKEQFPVEGNWKEMDFYESGSFLSKNTRFITLVEQSMLISRLSK